MKIKLSNVDSLTVARYAAGISIDFIGFSLRSQDEQSLTPREVSEILTWIEGPKVVLEIDENHVYDIAEFQKMFDPYAFEIITDKEQQKFWTRFKETILTPNDGIFLNIEQGENLRNLENFDGVNILAPQERETGILNFEAFDSFIEELRTVDQ